MSFFSQIVIPFFSLLIKDIYFLNEGCANRLPNGHVNFEVRAANIFVKQVVDRFFEPLCLRSRMQQKPYMNKTLLPWLPLKSNNSQQTFSYKSFKHFLLKNFQFQMAWSKSSYAETPCTHRGGGPQLPFMLNPPNYSKVISPFRDFNFFVLHVLKGRAVGGIKLLIHIQFHQNCCNFIFQVLHEMPVI